MQLLLQPLQLLLRFPFLLRLRISLGNHALQLKRLCFQLILYEIPLGGDNTFRLLQLLKSVSTKEENASMFNAGLGLSGTCNNQL